jgi:dienelactone hydrolase
MKRILSMFLWGVSCMSFAKVEPLIYKSDGTKFEGFVLKGPSGSPALLMIHNWMGVSKETEKQAQRFNELGYTVMAADIYGAGQRPTDSQSAGSLAKTYKTDRNLFRKRLTASLEALKSQKGVDPKKIAVLGYCFGGTGAVELARSGADLKGVVSFHGGLDSPEPALGKKIKAPILALHGAADPFVSKEDLKAFETEMKAAGVQYELVQYPGAVHSFTDTGAGTDPSKGAAYNEKADQESFKKAQEFLSKVFSSK